MQDSESLEQSIGERDFEVLRKLIYAETGITLTQHKRSLLSARLGRRLRHHGFKTFGQYCRYLRESDENGVERHELINCITTNKTEFFREAHHFEFLKRYVLEPLVARARQGGERKLRIWSAGCSTGEEPYSIGMTVLDALGSSSGWDVRILASDIDTKVLAHGSRGVYPVRALRQIPTELRKRFLEPQGKDAFAMGRAVRDLIAFRRINFVKEPWPIRSRFDVIFCRNVVIYFDKQTQERLYTRFCQLARPGGYLVAGHSENLGWMAPLLTSLGNTVYQVNERGAGAPRSLPARSLRNSKRPSKAAARASLAPSVTVRRGYAALPEQPSLEGSTRPSGTAKRRISVGSGRASQASKIRSAKVAKRHASPLSPGKEREHCVRITSGEVHASAKPTTVITVLGSCVAACLFDPAVAVGGMNHFMLPERRDNQNLAAVCYGVNAMEVLINDLLKLGAQRSRLVAKVFGASHVLDSVEHGRKVADGNAVFIREFLERESIPIVDRKLGLEHPLQIYFETHTGNAKVKVLGGAGSKQTLNNVEAKYLTQVSDEAYGRAEDAVLF